MAKEHAPLRRLTKIPPRWRLRRVESLCVMPQQHQHNYSLPRSAPPTQTKPTQLSCTQPCALTTQRLPSILAAVFAVQWADSSLLSSRRESLLLLAQIFVLVLLAVLKKQMVATQQQHSSLVMTHTHRSPQNLSAQQVQLKSSLIAGEHPEHSAPKHGMKNLVK